MVNEMKDSIEIKNILKDLKNMEKELSNIQDLMNKSLAVRLALLERIAELAKSEEREIVFEKTEKIRMSRRRSLD